MPMPNWLKTAALATTTLAVSFGHVFETSGQTLETMQRDVQEAGAIAKRQLVQKIKSYDFQTVRAGFAEKTRNTAVEERLRDDSDIHAALLFYCDPSISYKIAGFRSADGPELVREDKRNKRFIVRQADKRRTDTLENIYSHLDPQTRFQICTTYDRKTDDLVLHLGGTDFNNMDDIGQASLALSGMVSNRSADGATYASKALQAFRIAHPEMNGRRPNIAIVSHSQGAASVPAAMVALQGVDQAVLYAPFGATAPFETVEATTGIAPKNFRKNVTSILPQSQGLLDMFEIAIAPVGTIRQSQVPRHDGKAFIETFNAQRAAIGARLR